jgi:hypothetical protein
VIDENRILKHLVKASFKLCWIRWFDSFFYFISSDSLSFQVFFAFDGDDSWNHLIKVFAFDEVVELDVIKFFVFSVVVVN